MNRNNYIYTWQINRNPFIDYPNLADYIWGIHAGEQWFYPLSTIENEALKVVVYPNPAKNFIIVSGLDQESSIEIYNTLGEKLYKTTFSGETRIDLNLSSGIYLAKITSGTKNILRKIVVK